LGEGRQKLFSPYSFLSLNYRKRNDEKEYYFIPLGNCSCVALLTYFLVGITQPSPRLGRGLKS